MVWPRRAVRESAGRAFRFRTLRVNRGEKATRQKFRWFFCVRESWSRVSRLRVRSRPQRLKETPNDGPDTRRPNPAAAKWTFRCLCGWQGLEPQQLARPMMPYFHSDALPRPCHCCRGALTSDPPLLVLLNRNGDQLMADDGDAAAGAGAGGGGIFKGSGRPGIAAEL